VRAVAALLLVLAACGRRNFDPYPADGGPGFGVPDGGFVPAMCAPGEWCWQNPLPIGVHWYAVGGSGVDVWTVGDAGYALHWDGATYTVERAATTILRAVWVGPNNDVRAVGDGGVIVRRVGGSWATETSPVTANLTGVHGAGINDVWAVDDTGAILHYDGNGWSVMFTATGPLRGVWASSATDVWTVGDFGLAIHYDGSFRTEQTRTMANIEAVWGSGPTDVFAVSAGAILHYDGARWNVTGPAITTIGSTALGGTGPTRVAVHKANSLYELEGTTWTETAWPSNINGIYGDPSGALWQVGDCGVVDRRDPAGAWGAVLPIPRSGTIYSKWHAPDGAWWVTSGRFVLRKGVGDVRWSTVHEDAQGVATIWGMDATDLWVGHQFDGTILHYDGFSWTPFSTALTGGITDIDGMSSTEVWATGMYGAVRWNGASWTSVSVPASTSYGVLVFGPQDVWAGSSSTTPGLWHYNGSWTNAVPSGHAYEFDGVGVDQWAGGGNGIFSWDGSTWVQRDTTNAYSISVVSPTDVWASLAGYATVRHFDGSTWQTSNAAPGAHINQVWATPTEVSIGGECGQILTLSR